MKYDIFISYSRKDTAIVHEYCEYLEAAGLSVWIDRNGIHSGAEFKSVIVDAIDASDVFLFFSSVNSNKSSWTVKEVNVAVDSKKTIIPVKLDDSKFTKSIRFDLAGLDYSNQAESSFEDCIRKLLARFGKDYDEVKKLVEYNRSQRKSNEHPSEEKMPFWLKCCFAFQCAVFAAILFVCFRAYTYHFLTKFPSIYNTALIACLLGTIYSTYQLYCRRKWAVYAICILDVVEVILVCVIASLVAGFRFKVGYYKYTVFPYNHIVELGNSMAYMGKITCTLILEIFAMAHSAVMILILKTKYHGTAFWDTLK